LYSCTCSIITEGTAKVVCPARNITACVTAPEAGGDLHAPAERRDLVLHHVHADAAARDLAHFLGGREPRQEDELRELRFGQLDVRREETRGDGLFADAREVEPRAVVRDGEHDFVAALGGVDRDLADLGLARREARRGGLDAVRDRIAQQVLEGRGDFFEDGAIELGARALQLEVRLLVELLRGLAHDAVEPIREVSEGHEAHAHEALLQLAVQPRLRVDRELGLVQVLLQALVQRDHVAQALGEEARELLHAREAVELERVEVLAVLLLQLDGALHLAFGCELDLAQLRAHARDVVGEVDERAPEGRHLALDARARDGKLARLVHEAVDRVGVHAQ
jgi:hypothetical protein